MCKASNQSWQCGSGLPLPAASLHRVPLLPLPQVAEPLIEFRAESAAASVIGAIAFGGGIWATMGPQKGAEYFAGYLLEQSLSGAPTCVHTGAELSGVPVNAWHLCCVCCGFMASASALSSKCIGPWRRFCHLPPSCCTPLSKPRLLPCLPQWTTCLCSSSSSPTSRRRWSTSPRCTHTRPRQSRVSNKLESESAPVLVVLPRITQTAGMAAKRAHVQTEAACHGSNHLLAALPAGVDLRHCHGRHSAHGAHCGWRGHW